MKKNLIIAIVLFLAIAFWMLSGIFKTEEGKEGSFLEQEEPAHALFTVEVQEIESQKLKHILKISAKTLPSRQVHIRSELDARVMEIGAKRGHWVAENALIVDLNPEEIKYDLQGAQASLKQAELELRAAKQLFEKKLISEQKLAEARSNEERARALAVSLQIDLKNTHVVAPFEGYLQDRFVEKGDYLKVGDNIAHIVDVDPIIVKGDVTEADINKLSVGMKGSAQLPSGAQLEGFVRYISPLADESSRTFSVELEVPNPHLTFVAGQTAILHLPLQSIEAHKILPSSLTLDRAGALGVKIVDEHDEVQFIPAQIVQSDKNTVWLSGLPKKIKLITVGQEFVKEKEKVNVSIKKNNTAS